MWRNKPTHGQEALERCLVASVIRKMWLKITVKYHFTSARMAAIFKIEITSVGEDRKTLEPPGITWDVKWCSHWWNIVQWFLSKQT